MLLPPPDVGGVDDDRGGAVIAASVVAFVLTAAVVALRFYTRCRIVHVLGSEDWTILVALVFSLGVSICEALMMRFGFGRHLPVVSASDMVHMAKTSFALMLLYQLSLAFTKVSILILYLRIVTYHYARWAVYFMLGVVVVCSIFGFVTQATTCVPLSKLWSYSVSGYCRPPSYTWAIIGLHIATDFLIFFLPIPVFFNVTMSSKKKIILLALFTVGFISCIISTIRVVRLRQLATHPDFTYDNVELAYWNLAEVNTSIICACLMTFKPLLSPVWTSLSRVITSPKPQREPSAEPTPEPYLDPEAAKAIV